MSSTRQAEVPVTREPLGWQLDGNAFPEVSQPAPARFHPRLFWLLHVGGWAGYFLHGYMSGIAHGKEMGYWKLPLTTAVAGLLATLALRYLLRALWRLPPMRLLLAITPAIVVASGVMGAAFLTVLIEWCGNECRPASGAGYVAYMFSYLYVVLAWVGLYIGIKYYRQLKLQTEAALAATAMAHQAQLKMLRYQLNPHFLFNTLNAISTLILDRDTGTANAMVQRLSAFLRHSLDKDPMQRVTLRQELDAIRLYLDIETVRFAERLRVRIEVPEDCCDALLPSLLLQPLIENAIKYAVASSVDGGTLEISAQRDADQLKIRVADDGPGCPGLDNGEGAHRGVGLENTRERLRVLFGDRQSFDVHNRQPHGLEVVIALPYQRAQA